MQAHFEGATGGPSRCDPRRPLPAPVPAIIFARSLADRGSLLQTESHLATGRRTHARGAPGGDHPGPTQHDFARCARLVFALWVSCAFGRGNRSTCIHIALACMHFLMKSMRIGAAAARELPWHPACSRPETSRIAPTHKPRPPQRPHRCPEPHPPATSPG